MSRISLHGLVHKCSVIRKDDADDGAGGITPTGSEHVAYSDWPCRVTTLEDDKDKQRGFGFDEARHRAVTMEYAPKVRRSDFVRLPWGVPPNIETPLALADGTPPIGEITTGNVTFPVVTFTWNETTSLWVDDVAGNMSLSDDGGSWRFQNSEDALDLTLGATATTNPFAHYLWGEQSGYSVDQTTSTVDYRIVWYKHQSDDYGDQHHTTLVIELEDVDT